MVAYNPIYLIAIGALAPLLFIYLRSIFQQNRQITAPSATDSLDNESIERRYKLLTDNLAASIVIRNAEGKITYCSPYTEVLTGYALSHIYNCEADFFMDVAHEDDKENLQRALKISAIGEAFQFRFRFYHKTGILMWAETRTVPILNQDGQVTSSLSITLDVTGTVLYQKQVEEKNRDLQDFTYMVSHDLKAPIFTIKGMLGILHEDPVASSSEDIKEPLTHISKAASRLEQLVSSVLEYSKISTQEFAQETVNTKAVLHEVVEELQPQLQKLGSSIIIENDLPDVLCNQLRLYQIFANLLGNALKYKSQQRIPHITVRSEANKNRRYVTFLISDNGLGIPNDKLDSIFRPFQRVHAQVEGSGIGLACVKKLVEKSGGQITVQSQEDVGSTFRLTLRARGGE